MKRLACFTLSVAIASISFAADREALLALGNKPVPPAMPKRSITAPTTAPAGRQIEIVEGTSKLVLFLPTAYVPAEDGTVDLTIHFHGATWAAIDEHLRRDLAAPLLAVHLGEGSSVYGKPFKEDADRFARWIELTNAALTTAIGRPMTVKQIDITSFSAGYGSVREILQQDRYIAMIRRVILADSLYAGWDPATTQPGATSRPAIENMQPYVKFIELAARGEKTFVLTHSHVPTSYANTAATAAWLIERVGAPRVETPASDALPATLDPLFPLVYRADVGHFHVWGYGGNDLYAHLTHIRHIADVWRALDACGDR